MNVSLTPDTWIDAAILRDVEQALDATVVRYNEAIEEVTNWVTETASEFRDQFDDKSERWQEGEAGEAASAWVEEWKGFETEPVELPDSVADALDDLPDQPG